MPVGRARGLRSSAERGGPAGGRRTPRLRTVMTRVWSAAEQGRAGVPPRPLAVVIIREQDYRSTAYYYYLRYGDGFTRASHCIPIIFVRGTYELCKTCSFRPVRVAARAVSDTVEDARPLVNCECINAIPYQSCKLQQALGLLVCLLCS